MLLSEKDRGRIGAVRNIPAESFKEILSAIDRYVGLELPVIKRGPAG